MKRVFASGGAVAAFGLAVVAGLSWIWLWQGAGMGMSALDMSALVFFPHARPEAAGSMDPSLATTILMWWVMMAAMMTPGAAPLVLLYRRVLAHRNMERAASLSMALLCGYLVAWLGFSIAAALLQKALQPTGLLSPMMLWSKNAWLSAAVLGAAGAYQLSPLKRACLAQCRSPANFLMAHWRAGPGGSFRLGVLHGAYCVGCCWLLMALLFVVGIMNLFWIAVLSAVVLAEKSLPRGEQIGRVLGVMLIAWAGITLLV
jgi:predicted metal-binding membrane protein